MPRRAYAACGMHRPGALARNMKQSGSFTRETARSPFHARPNPHHGPIMGRPPRFFFAPCPITGQPCQVRANPPATRRDTPDHRRRSIRGVLRACPRLRRCGENRRPDPARMTDTYLLRLTGVQRDFLLELLRGRAEDTAHFLYGHLLNAEEWDPRRKIEATTVTGLSREEFTDLLRPVEPTLATRDDVLERAGALIGGTRAETYGSARESFTRIGMLWGDILGQPVLATDVARMMIAMKLSRLHLSADHADSWVDIAGYAALGAEIAGVEL